MTCKRNREMKTRVEGLKKIVVAQSEKGASLSVPHPKGGRLEVSVGEQRFTKIALTTTSERVT
jgi:hypothetical protein